MSKTQTTQKVYTPRLSWYSFRGIWRPFQPSHLKNHEFHFFRKLPTKPSSYVVPHRKTWACAKPIQLKTFVHKDFLGVHLGAFGGHSNLHISKTKNFIFSQNSPPSHLVVSCYIAKLAMCKTQATENFRAPRLSFYSFGEIVGNSYLCNIPSGYYEFT